MKIFINFHLFISILKFLIKNKMDISYLYPLLHIIEKLMKRTDNQ